VKVEWKSKPLGQVATFLNGLWKGEKPPYVTVGVIRNTNFAKDGLIDDSDIAWLDVEAKKFERRKLKFGDIILEKSGGGPKQPVGRVALFEKEHGDYSFSNFTSAIRPNDSHELDFRFLHKFLFWKYATGVTESMQSHSTGIRNLNADAYKEILIPLPPLAEQQHIVAILDEAFAGLATATVNAEKNLKNAPELFDSYLNSIFALPRDTWTTCPLADCVQFVTYGFTNPMPTTEVGPWMVTAKNVVEGKIDYNSARHTSRDAFENLLSDKSRPKMGDVLLTKDGTLGRLAVVDRDQICINQSVALLRPNGRMIAQLMKYLLSSRDYQRRMIGDADGATIKHIYITRVPKMDVAFPSSLNEQEELVAKLDALLDSVKELENAYEHKLDSFRDLKQSILQKAFSGELNSSPSQAVREAAE
jgi:type I restriction enzyme S subunit